MTSCSARLPRSWPDSDRASTPRRRLRCLRCSHEPEEAARETLVVGEDRAGGVSARAAVMAGFLAPLRIEELPGDDRKWRLLEPCIYHLTQPDGEEWVEAPLKFVTDFGSIP